MKQGIGNKKTIIGIIIGILVVIVLIATIVYKLTWKYEYYDEATVLKQYMERFEEPEQVEIQKLDKYVATEETYYHIKVFYPPFKETNEFELLLVFNHNSRIMRMVHFGDIEAGYFDDEKAIWEMISPNGPDVSFSQEVIDEIVEVVLTK